MERNILELLEHSAVLFADKIAVKDSEEECTFAELARYSAKVGSLLNRHELYGKTIPVYMEKGVLTLEIFFGIVYAGGSYSSINPTLPKERVEAILQTLDAPVIITDSSHLNEVSEFSFSGEVLLAEELLQGEVDERALAKIRQKVLDTDALYVNFTSGSTGMPKGVVVGHKSVIEFIRYFTSIFHITSEDIIGNQAPFDFDVSVKDIYSMLMTGATMYIIPKEAFSFPQKLLDILVREEITTLIWAVSALCIITSLKGFRYKVPERVNKVLFSGEVMPVKHLQEWQSVLPQAQFVNLYGPTEITCNCTYYIINSESDITEGIPIGEAFPNEKVFLLNEEQQEVCEPGAIGEICVSGSTLALGYFKDREKTDKVFVQNPLNNRYNELIYRTGDLAYYLADGNLMYVGRKDFQIKHMGYRIELLEIDCHIGKIQGIERVCCLYDEQKKQIVAVYQGDVEKSTIKAELRKKLIKYMIPERIISVEQMPLTANGKIDRKKLMKDYMEE